MKQQVILDVFGIPTRVELTIGQSDIRSFHFCFGIISTTISKYTSLDTVKQRIEKVFSKNQIAKLNHEPFFYDDSAYVFGNVEYVYYKNKDDKNLKNTYLKVDDKMICLWDIFKDYVELRTLYYETLMHTYHHTIAYKDMVSILGNNHLKEKKLTFNVKMVHFSKQLIDSVIIHELSHDFEANHSEKFYNYVDKYCLNYKEKREKLIYGIRK